MQATSLAAYASVQNSISANAQCILDYMERSTLYPNGMTAYEVGLMLKMKPQSVSARINELHTQGKLVDGGARRPTDTGRKAIVWRTA